MFRTLDLRSVGVVTAEPETAVATFQRSFGLPVTRQGAGIDPSTRVIALGIGVAEIVMIAPTGEGSPVSGILVEQGPGLYNLVLAVDDLSAATAELSARGLEVAERQTPDHRLLLPNPRQTHGVRIALVERGPIPEESAPR
jgi:hypothetical protein